jgi:hypothetical protein
MARALAAHAPLPLVETQPPFPICLSAIPWTWRKEIRLVVIHRHSQTYFPGSSSTICVAADQMIPEPGTLV